MKLISKQSVYYIFTVIVLSFIAYYLIRNWESVSSVRLWENPGFLCAHIVLFILTFTLFVIGWYKLLIITGNAVDAKAACFSWLVPNIGKYLPGKVFMVAGRIALLNRSGVRKASAVGNIIWEHVMLVLAAMPSSLFILLNYSGEFSKIVIFAMLLVLIVMLIVVLNPITIQRFINVLLKIFKKNPLELVLKRKAILYLFTFYMLIWTVYGLSGVSLAYALGMEENVSMLLLFNIYIFSWLIGFLSMVTPGGIGIREGVLILMISSYVPMSELMVFALFARITWTITELVGVLIGLLFGYKLRSKCLNKI